MNKVVYVHKRLDTDAIFYVGMGSLSRVSSKLNRNKHWHNLVNKNGYYTEIVAENLSINDAYELEMLLISELGRKDLGKGSLVNMTEGGDGCSVWSKERTKIMIEKNLKNMKSVSQYDSDGNFVKKYRSISKASKESGVARQTIRDCVNNKLKTSDNYAWISSDVKYTHNKDRFDKGSKAMMYGNNHRAKKVINNNTGVIYESLSSAFDSQDKYKSSAFSAHLRGQNINKTNYKYV